MARIRSIKPEFFSDETVMELTVEARYLWIGLWVFADDWGNQDASVKQTRARIFPSDSVTVESLLDELKAHRLLVEYSVNGKAYWNIPNFRKHQKIDRPSRPKFPRPDQGTLVEDASRTQRPLAVGSGSGSGSGRDIDLPPVEDSSRVESSPAVQVQVQTESRPSVRKIERCTILDCKARPSVRSDGRWYCSRHATEQDRDPAASQGATIDLAAILSDNEKFLRP